MTLASPDIVDDLLNYRLSCLLNSSGAMITELVSKRLIRRLRVAQDGRRALLDLTDAGQALYGELFPQSAHYNNLVLSVLTAAELDVFDRALGKLLVAAQKLAAERPVREKADRRHGGARKVRR